MLGAIPVFVDVDPETLLIDPALIDQAVTPGRGRSCRSTMADRRPTWTA